MSDEIRPFKIHVSDADLEDLKKRLRATRWPDLQTVPDSSQGIPLRVRAKNLRILGARLRLAQNRSPAQRSPSIPHRPGWRRHLLSAYPFTAVRRDTIDPDAWLARIGHRILESHSSLDRSV